MTYVRQYANRRTKWEMISLLTPSAALGDLTCFLHKSRICRRFMVNFMTENTCITASKEEQKSQHQDAWLERNSDKPAVRNLPKARYLQLSFVATLHPRFPSKLQKVYITERKRLRGLQGSPKRSCHRPSSCLQSKSCDSDIHIGDESFLSSSDFVEPVDFERLCRAWCLMQPAKCEMARTNKYTPWFGHGQSYIVSINCHQLNENGKDAYHEGGRVQTAQILQAKLPH